MWITGEVRRAIVVHMFDVGVFGLIVSLLGWPCRYFSGAHLRLGRGVASLRASQRGVLLVGPRFCFAGMAERGVSSVSSRFCSAASRLSKVNLRSGNGFAPPKKPAAGQMLDRLELLIR